MLTRKFVPRIGRHHTFVHRDRLRWRGHRLLLNPHAMLASTALSLPAPPSVIDWSQGRKVVFPMDGNDQYGDCFYAAACHSSNLQTFNAHGVEDVFDPAAIVRAYLTLSGGDNGLSADEMFGEWKRGLLGGPHKIWDVLGVSPTDPASVALGLYHTGGLQLTLAIPDAWLQREDPNDVWDAGAGVWANPENGHAVLLSGQNSDGTLNLETWGLTPPIRITRAGLAVCDPELFAVASPDWFNPQGKTPANVDYPTFAATWKQWGGITLPPLPGPTPVPPVPGPTPPPGPDVLAKVDGLFRQTEGRLTGRALRLVEQLRQQVDRVLGA